MQTLCFGLQMQGVKGPQLRIVVADVQFCIVKSMLERGHCGGPFIFFNYGESQCVVQASSEQ